MIVLLRDERELRVERWSIRLSRVHGRYERSLP